MTYLADMIWLTGHLSPLVYWNLWERDKAMKSAFLGCQTSSFSLPNVILKKWYARERHLVTQITWRGFYYGKEGIKDIKNKFLKKFKKFFENCIQCSLIVITSSSSESHPHIFNPTTTWFGFLWKPIKSNSFAQIILGMGPPPGACLNY